MYLRILPGRISVFFSRLTRGASPTFLLGERALGEGRWDGIWGILGMLAGAALFAESYPLAKRTLLTWGDYGKLTVPEVLGVSHWLVILVFIAGGMALFTWFEKKGL